MTTEEFEGHLMAALRGPNSKKIVTRIVEVLVEDFDEASVDDIAELMDKLAGAAFVCQRPLRERLYAMEVLALATDHTPARGPGMMSDILLVQSMRSEMLRRIRDTCGQPSPDSSPEVLRVYELLGITGSDQQPDG